MKNGLVLARMRASRKAGLMVVGTCCASLVRNGIAFVLARKNIQREERALSQMQRQHKIHTYVPVAFLPFCFAAGYVVGTNTGEWGGVFGLLVILVMILISTWLWRTFYPVYCVVDGCGGRALREGENPVLYRCTKCGDVVDTKLDERYDPGGFRG